jgi:hypothetical protein
VDKATSGSERKWVLDMDHSGTWHTRSLWVYPPAVDVGAVRVYARAGKDPSQIAAALRALAAKMEEGLTQEPKKPNPQLSPSAGTPSRW